MLVDASRHTQKPPTTGETMPRVEKQVTVRAPAPAVYAVWHNFENFPRFMSNIKEVRAMADGLSHWKAKGPLGASAEWDAEVTMDEPAHAIGWRSIDGSSLTTAGRVDFDDLGDTTRGRVMLQYDAPAGPAGNLVAKLFSDPERQVGEDLDRFKLAMERAWGASGMAHGDGGGQQYGSSLGGLDEHDIDEIERHNSPDTSPTDIDDPARRQA
jgi:uncharacterized membrane protein